MYFKGPYGSREVNLCFGEYSNGRLYIGAYNSEEGPMFDATINLPKHNIASDEAFIKNYSENEGVLEFLMENDIVLKVVYYVPSGFVMVPLCKLNMEKINELRKESA